MTKQALFKFDLYHNVFYLKDNKVHSDEVHRRLYTDTILKGDSIIPDDPVIKYGVGEDMRLEHTLFGSKKELLDSL